MWRTEYSDRILMGAEAKVFAEALSSLLDEAIMGTLFKHLNNKIIIEIDEPELGSDWRELLVAARKEMQGEEIPDPTCEDFDIWDLEVDELANAILWDRDYEDGDIYMDHPPEKTEWLKYMAMIPDNYYTAIADDLTDEEAQVKIKELRKLCNSVIRAS